MEYFCSGIHLIIMGTGSPTADEAVGAQREPHGKVRSQAVGRRAHRSTVISLRLYEKKAT